MTRRELLAGAAALTAAAPPTTFQIGCMTLPYARFSLERALEGIARAGHRYLGWGTTHQGKSILEATAPPSEARRLAERCRGLGLDPVMMFAQIFIEEAESVPVHTRRIEQAAAAGIPFIITFGHTRPGAFETWVRNLKTLGPIARANGVTITIKQHGGNSATGRDCSKVIAAVADEGVRMCYDAGNVLDYESTDPLPDIQACWRDVRSFAIKDHRNFPGDQDCGPGFGEIDHYKLLTPVLNTGLTIPLICENIFVPFVPRPQEPEALDALALRAREFLEAVIAGLRAKP